MHASHNRHIGGLSHHFVPCHKTNYFMLQKRHRVPRSVFFSSSFSAQLILSIRKGVRKYVHQVCFQQTIICKSLFLEGNYATSAQVGLSRIHISPSMNIPENDSKNKIVIFHWLVEKARTFNASMLSVGIIIHVFSIAFTDVCSAFVASSTKFHQR